MSSLDRFASGQPDPQEQPLEVIGYCEYTHCGNTIFEGDDHIEDCNKLYCGELHWEFDAANRQ